MPNAALKRDSEYTDSEHEIDTNDMTEEENFSSNEFYGELEKWQAFRNFVDELDYGQETVELLEEADEQLEEYIGSSNDPYSEDFKPEEIVEKYQEAVDSLEGSNWLLSPVQIDAEELVSEGRTYASIESRRDGRDERTAGIADAWR